MALIEEGEGSVEDADCNALDPSLNSQLVFLSCDLTGLGSLRVAAPFAPPPPPPILPPPPPPGVPPPPPYIAPDPYAWASAPNGLRIDTKIEYYAWVEHKHCITVDCSGPGTPSTFSDGTPSGCRTAGTSMDKCDYTMSAQWTESIQTSFDNPAKTGQQYYDAQQNRCKQASRLILHCLRRVCLDGIIAEPVVAPVGCRLSCVSTVRARLRCRHGLARLQRGQPSLEFLGLIFRWIRNLGLQTQRTDCVRQQRVYRHGLCARSRCDRRDCENGAHGQDHPELR